MTVIGTRPEAIKLAPVVRALRRRPDRFAPLVCATAQHRQMLDQALQAFDIRPDHDLEVMEPGQTLARLTARIVRRFDELLERVRPDVVLGDTTTAMCCALVQHPPTRLATLPGAYPSTTACPHLLSQHSAPPLRSLDIHAHFLS